MSVRRVRTPRQKVYGDVPLLLPLIKMSDAEHTILDREPHIYDKNYPLDWDGLFLNPSWSDTPYYSQPAIRAAHAGNVAMMPAEARMAGFGDLGLTAAQQQAAAARQAAAAQAAAQRAAAQAAAQARQAAQQQAAAQQRAAAQAAQQAQREQAELRKQEAEAKRIAQQNAAKAEADRRKAEAEAQREAARAETERKRNEAEAERIRKTAEQKAAQEAKKAEVEAAREKAKAEAERKKKEAELNRIVKQCENAGGKYDAVAQMCGGYKTVALFVAAKRAQELKDKKDAQTANKAETELVRLAKQCQQKGGAWDEAARTCGGYANLALFLAAKKAQELKDKKDAQTAKKTEQEMKRDELKDKREQTALERKTAQEQKRDEALAKRDERKTTQEQKRDEALAKRQETQDKRKSEQELRRLQQDCKRQKGFWDATNQACMPPAGVAPNAQGCPPGYVIDPSTGQCMPTGGPTSPPIYTGGGSQCPADSGVDPVTGQCVYGNWAGTWPDNTQPPGPVQPPYPDQVYPPYPDPNANPYPPYPPFPNQPYPQIYPTDPSGGVYPSGSTYPNPMPPMPSPMMPSSAPTADMFSGGGGGGGGMGPMPTGAGPEAQMNEQANQFAEPLAEGEEQPEESAIAENEGETEEGNESDASGVASANVFESISKLFSGMNGVGCGLNASPAWFNTTLGGNAPVMRPRPVTRVAKKPVKKSTTSGTLMAAGVLVLSSAAIFLWSKSQKKSRSRK